MRLFLSQNCPKYCVYASINEKVNREEIKKFYSNSRL